MAGWLLVPTPAAKAAEPVARPQLPVPRASAARRIPAARSYLLLLGAAYRSQLQYRGNFLMVILAGVAYQGVGLAFVWVVVEKFGSVGGWSMGEIAFLYGMRLTSHALWTVPMHCVVGIDWQVKNGEFDRYLIRPVGLMTQMLTSRFAVQVLGDLLGGVGILLAAGSMVDIDWSPGAVLLLLAALAGGAMVEASFQLAIGSLTFRMLDTRALRMQVIDSLCNTFGGYPLKIFPGTMRFALTFVLPLAFIAYLPTGVLLDRTDELHVAEWLAIGAPLLGPLLLGLAYLFWRSQIKHYSSSGS
jgi:ABC-2 type transport system permease protein